MAHRRTPSVIQAMKLRDAEEDNPVGINAAIRVLSAAATAIAPALPLPSMRSSLDMQSLRTSSSASTTVCGDDDHEDSMSTSSLDVYTFNSPTTPGTPSKLFPHPPRRPSFIAEHSECNALTKAQYSLRRFVSRIFASLPPRVPISLPLKSPHLSASSPQSYFASLPTRPHGPVRRRATFLALLALIALCTWTLFTSSLGDPQSLSRPYSEGMARTWKDWRSSHPGDERSRLLNSALFRAASTEVPVRKPVDGGSTVQQRPATTLEFTPSDELAALTAFIAALPWNALPSHADPSHPLDPTIILDFDPSHPRAHSELAELVRETWQLNPVVLFGKSRHGPTREVRAVLEKLGVDVKAGVMEVDVAERVDREIVLGVLGRLVSSLDSEKPTPSERLELPLLLIGGKPIQYEAVSELVEGGELAKMLRDVDVKMAAPGKKKKGHKRGAV